MAAVPRPLQLPVQLPRAARAAQARVAQAPRALGSLPLLCVFGVAVAARQPRVARRGRNYYTNIAGKKGPAERKQAKLTARHLRQITLAMKEGGPDPDVNSMLSRHIRSALKDNVPRDTINRRMKAFTEKKDMFEEVEMQGYGPGGAAVVIEAMTDNMNRTRSAIKDAFKGCNGEVKNVGDHIFTVLGVLEFEGVEEEQVFEISLEADAEVEDVITREDGIVEVTTLPENFQQVVSCFEEAGMEPRRSQVERKVEVEASLNHQQSYEVMKLLHELEECDDIGEIHHNAVFADDVELKYTNYGIPLPYATAYKK